MTEPLACPRCGRELPDDAPRGLCPACLLGAALAGPGDDLRSDPGLGRRGPSEVGDTAADPRRAEGRPGRSAKPSTFDSRESSADGVARGPATVRYFGDYEILRARSAAAAWASSTGPGRSASTGRSP